MVERAVRGIELGLEEDAAIGYGLQRGGTFVGEAKPNEQLDGKEEISSLYNDMLISRSTLIWIHKVWKLMTCFMHLCIKVYGRFLLPWPFWGAAAAPAEAADRGSWRRQAPPVDAASRSTPSRGCPCSDAEWSGTFPFPLRHTGCRQNELST